MTLPLTPVCPLFPSRHSHLLLPPSPLGCVRSQALDVAAASPGVRPAVTCCSSRALSAACAHRLLFSRRRRPVSVLAARLRALLLEWRHRPLCLTPPSPLVATFIIKNSRTSADTSARARCIGQTTERGGGSGELLRAMFHNHCHASNRRIHQAPLCDMWQIAQF